MSREEPSHGAGGPDQRLFYNPRLSLNVDTKEFGVSHFSRFEKWPVRGASKTPSLTAPPRHPVVPACPDTAAPAAPTPPPADSVSRGPVPIFPASVR